MGNRHRVKQIGYAAIVMATAGFGVASSGCLLLVAGAIEASKTSTPAPPSPPDEIHTAPEPPAPTPTPAQRDKDAVPFDRRAAATALDQASEKVQICKADGGPTGAGHVTLTFGTNGRVQSAVADQPPFADTPTGVCVAGKFSEARVPPFTGVAVKVGKNFTIE